MECMVSRVGRVVFLILPIIGCESRAVKWCRAGGTTEIVSSDQPPAPLGSDAPWPNEPAGLTLVTDAPFHALNENGWRGQGSGLAVAADPPGAPSRGSTLVFAYGPGFPGGNAPGVEFYHLPTPTRETYFGFWWKASAGWQNHAASGVNKIALLFPATSGAGAMYIMMFFDDTNYTIQVEPTFAADTRRLAPNVHATPVRLGAWHRVEWYARYSTTATSRDGVTRWWLDGELQGEHTDLQMPPDSGFLEYTIRPVWGGVGDVKTQTDCYWFRHAHISRG
jgi:hypothetical protein